MDRRNAKANGRGLSKRRPGEGGWKEGWGGRKDRTSTIFITGTQRQRQRRWRKGKGGKERVKRREDNKASDLESEKRDQRAHLPPHCRNEKEGRGWKGKRGEPVWNARAAYVHSPFSSRFLPNSGSCPPKRARISFFLSQSIVFGYFGPPWMMNVQTRSLSVFWSEFPA